MKKNLHFQQIALALVLMITTASISAQTTADTTNPVASTSTDANFANTTVIFRAVNTSDMEVLNSVSSGFGMGDVVRIAVAPPTPPPAATIERQVAAPVSTAAPVVSAPKPVVAAPQVKPAQKVAEKPVVMAKPVLVDTPRAVTSAPKTVKKATNNTTTPKAPVQVAAPVEQKAVVSAPQVVKTTTAKSAKKSTTVRKHKKSSGISLFKPRYKNKKAGKQRYSCPKF
jgi:hypothetical protein